MLKDSEKILLIIPAYNEEESIEPVVDELISSYPELDYVVVTDGSTDNTPVLCRKRGYNILELPINLGLAGCFQTGMKYAKKHGYKYAVQFDGDGQHRPEYILPMRDKMREGYDIILGSRFIGLENSMGGMRSLGSKLIALSIRLTTGKRITDPTCGLRMYNKKMIDAFADNLNYAPEPDTISFLVKNGAKVAEVPVKVREREAGESYLKPVNAAKYMMRMLISIFIIQNFRKTS